jgi:ArsR family transcriptional regulator
MICAAISTFRRSRGLTPPLAIHRFNRFSQIVSKAAAKAKKNNLKNLEFRLGDLQAPPLEPESVDVAILSQALHHAEEPAKALAAVHKILKPGGQLLMLDLVRHQFEQAHHLYGDRWLGFAESELNEWLEKAGFKKIEISVVAREELRKVTGGSP